MIWPNSVAKISKDGRKISRIAYRGPTLIAEPELRWPILILAAVITALLAMFTAGLYYVAMTAIVRNNTGRNISGLELRGMFAEAVAEASKARELSEVSTRPIGFLAYALAKAGRRNEARAELEGLLRLTKERHVSTYNIAMILNGLGETDEALALACAWLQGARDADGFSKGRAKVEQLAR